MSGTLLAGPPTRTAVTFGMIPPEAWTADERLRGFAGLWSLLVFPLIGALAGVIRYRRSA